MADHEHLSNDDPMPALLDVPAGAQMLTTLGQATKQPGRCACGEHPDPHDAHADHDAHAGEQTR